MRTRLLYALAVCIASTARANTELPTAPCSKVGGEQWVLPQDARACISTIPFDKKIQENILDVVVKTLAFHVSTNYQLQAPPPYNEDVRWDLLKNLEDIRSREYTSDFEFHRDVQNTLKRVNDGHLTYANWCFDSVYVTYNPFPLVLLTNLTDNTQAVHIAPNAHEIASSAFGQEVKFWEDALQKPLQEFSGARVLRINGEEPFSSVNANAGISGRFQGLSSRQNAFFSSYIRREDAWSYMLGEFAEKIHPTADSVQMTIQRMGSETEEVITVPYRSKFNRNQHFSSVSDYQSKFCKATADTNGHHLYKLALDGLKDAKESTLWTADIKPTEATLPQGSQPALTPLEESHQDIEFYLLEDKTGVLVLGRFDGHELETFKCTLIRGLQKLRSLGATKLIIDLSNNLGGYVCVAHFLHRILFGDSTLTSPQAGLDTTIRVNDLGQKIVKHLAGNDPDKLLIFSQQWRNATHYPFKNDDWFTPVFKTVNGRQDAFSQRLGKECDVSSYLCAGKKTRIDSEPLFAAENVAIVSNGRCGSSCALFSVLLAKKHGVRAVVVGGKSDIPQHYCGFVGGQSVSFVDIDTALITTGLKRKSPWPQDIPPPLEANVAMTITWRLAYGIENPDEPEEWQDHTANLNLPLTLDIVNKPQAIWETVSRKLFPSAVPILQVQV